MMIQRKYWFQSIVLLAIFYNGAVHGETNVETLVTKIQGLQEKTDRQFNMFPPVWQTQRGSYKNSVKLNFHGDLELYMVRDLFSVPDINMFTPAWVTTCLIEAYEYGKAPRPSTSQIELALEAMDKFRNQNVPYKNSEMTFWPQTWNKTAKFYQSFPNNLLGVISLPDYLPNKLLEEVLNFLGLKDISTLIEKLIREK